MKIKKTLKKFGLGLLSIILLVIITGIVYEQIERNKAEKYLSSRKGNFIDVGMYKLYYESKGEGGPTVVFEPGFGGDHRALANSKIVDEISNYATTIVYDRAGKLWSGGGNEPWNAETVSSDLYKLLQNGKFEKPYILVGHSAAGIYLRPFLTKSNQDVSGVILLDPAHPDQIYKAPEDMKELLTHPAHPKWLLSFANATGIVRLLTGDPLIYHSIKSGGIYEERKYLNAEMTTLSPETTPGDVPLVVITAAAKFEGPKEYEVIYKKMQKLQDEQHTEIANFSSKGRRIISKAATHHNIFDVESELITKEILQMIQANNILAVK